MATSPAAGRHGALQTLLTIVAIAGGALLLLLLILVATGTQIFEPPREAMPPELAGLAVGKAAPVLAAEGWVNGEPQGFDGRVTVIQGWFYNCRFCWQEAPHLAELHNRLQAEHGDRVSFVALSPDPVDTRPLVEEFVTKNNITYPVGYGALDTLLGFDAQAFPVVWVVGPDGKVVWNMSIEDKQSLEEAIVAALNAPASGG